MKKYIVAYVNFFDNDLKITTINADNPVTAMIEGAHQLMDPCCYPWLNSLMEASTSKKTHIDRIEEIKEEFFNTDQLVAVKELL